MIRCWKSTAPSSSSSKTTSSQRRLQSTIPIEIAVASTPGLKFIRSNTVFALGFIRLQFEYGRDYHFVRQQALNRLKDADAAGRRAAGDLAGRRHQRNLPLPARRSRRAWTSCELKTLQDWVVERRLRIVPGVADVAVLGGKTKEFQVEIDLNRMMAFGLTLPQIMTAISASNANVGGRTISIGEQSVNVRGIGVITSIEDIGNIVLTQQGGVPVLLSDVAKVQIGFAPRLGMAGRDDMTDVVTGIVLMQKLERTMDVVHARARGGREASTPTARCRRASRSCRSTTAATSSRSRCNTVLHNLLFGVALIFLIQWLFLGDLRCALIVAATIPVALFLAVMITVLRGEFGQPAVGRRHRSRHHRRCHRDHGGEHLPPSRPSHRRAMRRIARRACSDKLQPHPDRPRSRSTRRSSFR